VPGALTLIGLTEYLGKSTTMGAEDLIGATGSMVAVALGVLCGHPFHRALDRLLTRRRTVRQG
jgi:hypothetical protein